MNLSEIPSLVGMRQKIPVIRQATRQNFKAFVILSILNQHQILVFISQKNEGNESRQNLCNIQ